MKNIYNSILGFIKAHTAAIVASAAVVAAVGIGAGVFTYIRSQRQNHADHVHNYRAEFITATCAHGSYTLHTCDCGDFYKENETDPLPHEYGDWKLLQIPTIDNEGQKERRCLHCNDRIVEIIPIIDVHKHSYEAVVVDPTCTEKGYTLQTCSTCGLKTTTAETKATGHSWSSWNVTKEATADNPGERSHTCQACGSTETEQTPKTSSTEHSHVYSTSVVDPTCSSQGYTLYMCACGHSYKGDYLPRQSHLYGNWTTIQQATTSSPGSRSCSCTLCGQTITEAIPQLTVEDAELYEQYIDSRIEIMHLASGVRRYTYKQVGVTDYRTWGDPPTIQVIEGDGLYVTYLKQDGTKVEHSFLPAEGYVRRLVIQEDGSYLMRQIGSFDD